MMFVDFGDCAVVSVQDIRLLPTRFQQMPCVAVNVKLAGVWLLFADSQLLVKGLKGNSSFFEIIFTRRMYFVTFEHMSWFHYHPVDVVQDIDGWAASEFC